MGKHVAVQPESLSSFNADWHPRGDTSAESGFHLPTEPLAEWIESPFTPVAGAFPSPALQQVLRGSLEANFIDQLGFNAWSSSLSPAERATVDRILAAASTHPDFDQFERYELGVESADHDAVTDLAYVILRDAMAKLQVTA